MGLPAPTCPHWSDNGNPIAGRCALNLPVIGAHPSRGTCDHCEHNTTRGHMLVTTQARPPGPLSFIPLPGDLIEAVAKRIGADRLANLWEKWTGRECGCSERKEKVNAAAKRLARYFRRIG